MALVLAPEGPVAEWLADLDALMARSPGFFAGRAIVARRFGAAAAQGRAQPSHRASCTRAASASWASRAPSRRSSASACRRRWSAAATPARSRSRRRQATGNPCRRPRRRPAGEADAGLAAARRPGPLRPVDHLPRGRRHRRRLGRVRRRDHRGRLDPRLRHAARPRHRRLDGQRPRPHLLPQARGRAPGDRRPLQDRRRHGPTVPRPRRPGLAQGRRDHDGTPGLTIGEGDGNGQGLGRDIGQGRGRQDHLDGRARRGAARKAGRTSSSSISTSACATSTS